MSSPGLHSQPWDVLVIGAGPAGTSLASLLSSRGRRCLVLEAHHLPRYHVGESLAPGCVPYLSELGFLDRLNNSGFPEKHGMRFLTGDGVQEALFYFSEFLPPERALGWQVDRGDFDRMLIDHARQHGVTVWEDSHVEEVTFHKGRATGAVVTRDQSRREGVLARVVVDASGRSCVLGRQLGLKTETQELRKTALWGYYRGGTHGTGIDAGETTVFLGPAGTWHWYIPLPDEVVSVGIVGQTGLVLAPDEHSEMAFHRWVEACPALHARLIHAKMVSPVRGIQQLGYVNRSTVGEGWVMVGDARAFIDPVLASGTLLALASAHMAAVRIEASLSENDFSAGSLGRWETRFRGGVDVLRRLVHALYDPAFSFRLLLERFPEQRKGLFDCLVGDVFKDMRGFTEALATLTPPPDPLPVDPQPGHPHPQG
jgi:flavin-dependent dehydrogenase